MAYTVAGHFYCYSLMHSVPQKDTRHSVLKADHLIFIVLLTSTAIGLIYKFHQYEDFCDRERLSRGDAPLIAGKD